MADLTEAHAAVLAVLPGQLPGQQFWYVACAASLLKESPRAARIFDFDLVLYRDAEGRPGAMLDRCCHRGAKLSLGRVTNGNLACGYHGWQYDKSGRCVHIPSLCEGKTIPEGVQVRAFPCVEQDGYIWIWTGVGAPQPETPARIPQFEEGAWKQGTVECKCSALMLLENQFDCAHPTFAHEGTHPAYFYSKVRGSREYEFEVRVTDNGMAAFYPPTASEEDPVPSVCESLTVFEMPNRVYIRQALFTIDFYLMLHIVPTGASTCRLEWLQRDHKKDSGIQWVDEETRLIEQDRLLLESAQPYYDECSDSFEKSVASDYVTLLLRKIIRFSTATAWENELTKLQRRRLVRVRS